MEYISAEEFLKQPKEIQEIFREWWKPSKGDLIRSKLDIIGGNDYNFDFIIRINPNRPNSYILTNSNWYGKGECIPLLTEGQIRQFIEDKTGYKIEAWWDGESYDIYFVNAETGIQTDEVYYNLGEDLLQAYWKVAIQITEQL